MTLPHTKSLFWPSIDATTGFAQSIARYLTPGDTILLGGELGTGKTHIAREIIQTRLAATGRTEGVPSPTYTLVQSYADGESDIWHADLYRLTNEEEVLETGLLDAMDDCICLIEWPDRLGTLRPKNALAIELFHCEKPKARKAELNWSVPKWNKLFEAAGIDNV